MESAALDAATAYVDEQELDLPYAGESAGDAAVPTFHADRRQAAVVDSNVVAFPANTPVHVRNAVSDWMLFAQLVATKKHPGGSDTEGWFDAYLEVLMATGWRAKGGLDNWTTERVVGSEVHQQMLKLVAVALAGSPALAIVTAALQGLQAMSEDSKWITLFDRRGKSTRSVGFSIASVEAEPGEAALQSVDFRVEASKTMTQVFFFKFTEDKASMYKRSMVLSLAEDDLQALGPKIAARVKELHAGNIAAYDLD